jgi:hypothetical protein
MRNTKKHSGQPRFKHLYLSNADKLGISKLRTAMWRKIWGCLLKELKECLHVTIVYRRKHKIPASNFGSRLADLAVLFLTPHGTRSCFLYTKVTAHSSSSSQSVLPPARPGCDSVGPLTIVRLQNNLINTNGAMDLVSWLRR